MKLIPESLKKIFVKKSIETSKKDSINVSSQEIIKNINIFSEKTVEDILVPRSDIISVESEVSLEDLSKNIISNCHTRTLVYEESLDKIIGFIHIKDLFEVVAKNKKFNIKKLIRKHIVSPHSMRLIDLLAKMQVNRTHIAVIVDEYGGTDGIVTIEDIIEEIVGEIDDEHDIDSEEDSFKILRPGLIVSSARAEISELEKSMDIILKDKEDETDTIGGLVMSKSGRVPAKGEMINILENVKVEILESTSRTIKRLKITYFKND